MTITRHGEPIARLVPADQGAVFDADAWLEELRAFRAAHPVAATSEEIRRWIDDGRH